MDYFHKEKLKRRSVISKVCTLESGRNSLRRVVLPYRQKDTWDAIVLLDCWEMIFSNTWWFY